MKKGMASSVKTLMPIDFPSLGVPWLMSAVSTVYGKAKVADRIPPVANVAISNVPGPAFPLYLAGAKMVSNYPTSIVVHGVALNITVQSYDASLDFGMMACGEAMPDVADLGTFVREAFEEMKALAPSAAAQPASAGTAVADGRKTPQPTAKRATSAKRKAPVTRATPSPRASAPSKKRPRR